MKVIPQLRFLLTYLATSLGLLVACGRSCCEGVRTAPDNRRSGSWGLSRLRTPVMVTLGAALLGACGGPGLLRVSDFEDLVQSMEAKSDLVDRFKTTFVKTRLSDVFNRALTVSGSLVFQKPNKFQLTMTGDVNVELLSDGTRIMVIHDGRDRETYEVQGDRDIAQFTDPLMALIESIGSGGLRDFRAVQVIEEEPSLLLRGEPTGQRYFERVERVILLVNELGQIRKVSLLFKDGNRDETIFQDWQVLARDHPDILQLDERLSRIMPERNSAPSMIAAETADRFGSRSSAAFRPECRSWPHSVLCGLGLAPDILAAGSPRRSPR